MITLTTAPAVNAVLGSASVGAYPKLIIDSVQFMPLARRINGTLSLSTTAPPDMPPISGNLSADLLATPPILTVTVPQLNFYRRVSLTVGQVASIQALIDGSQNNLENGLISLGLVAGTQSGGT